MPLTRWSIRSLRRFGDPELLINVYVLIGGILSLIYTGGAILRTKLYIYIFSANVMQNSHMIVHVALEIIVRAILRTVLWLPEMLYALLAQHQSLLDWITAAHILKDLT